MADNVILNVPDTSGATIATDEVAAVQHQLVKVEFGADGVATMVSAADPLPVTAAALPLPAGAATAANQQTNALTDAQLRAVAVPVSGTVTANLAAGTNNIGDVDVLTLPALVAGTAYVGKVRLTDGTTDTDIRDLANSNALNVSIVDGSGDQITSFGGGTQYTEDAVAAANPVGTAVNLIRQDTPAGLTTTDGDNVAQRGTNFGAGFVQVLTSAGAFVDTFGGGTQYADGAVRGTATGTLAMGDDGTNIQSVKVDAAGELQVDVLTMPAITGTVTANAGTNLNTSLLALEAGGNLAAILADTTNIETAVQLIDDTVATLGTTTYTETTTKGLITGAVRRDADTSAVNTDNEVAPLLVNAIGALKVEVFSGETLAVSLTSTTITGTVAVSATDLDIRNLVFATDKVDVSGSTLAANSGVDIGDVTINNAAGASAVNIQDGGNTITVDGTVAVTGVATETTLASLLTSSQLIDDTIAVLGTDTYTEAASKGQIIGAVRRDANTTLVNTTNEIAPLQVNSTGDLKVAQILALPAGDNNIGNVDIVTMPTVTVTATDLDIRNLVAATDIVDLGGNALTSLQLLDDTVFTAGTSTFTEATSKGNLSLAVRRDANTSLVDTTNEMTPLQVNATGDLKVAVIQALPAGSANIGDVDILSITASATTNKVDVGLVNGEAIDVGAGTEAAAIRVTLPTNGTGILAGVTTVTTLTTLTGTTSLTPGTAAANLGKAEDGIHGTGDVGVFSLSVANEAQTTLAADNDYIARASDVKGNSMVVGNIAHDGIDAGNPVLNGYRAIAHGTNPTAVAAADRTVGFANRAGVPFVIGGHPNVVTVRANYTGANTDAAIITVAPGLKIVVTRLSVTASSANTVNVSAVIGFGAVNTPTTIGVVLAHPGIAAGSGVVEGNGAGMLGVGADGEDLRITSSVPTTGSIDVICSYYTVES